MIDTSIYSIYDSVYSLKEEIMKAASESKKIIEETTVFHHHYAVTTSTLDVATELLPQMNTRDWFLITADEQTRGKGTHNRSWASPPQVNLYMTFLFPFPRTRMALLPNIPQVTSYAVILTLVELGFRPKIKWVNDVLLNRKKICGILCQAEFPPDLENYCAVKAGVGINVNMSQEICDSVDQPVTSLMLEANRSFNKDDVLRIFERHFISSIKLLIQHGFNYFRKAIAERMEYLGELIKVKDDTSDSIIEGTMVGVDEEGQLLLNTSTGQVKMMTGHIISQRVVNSIETMVKSLRDLNFPVNATKNVVELVASYDSTLCASILSFHYPQQQTTPVETPSRRSENVQSC